ncbi:MAG: sulfatase [Thermoguttaceae bacterium]
MRFLLAALCLVGGTGFSSETPAAPRPPNIVFILADDLGWGDLSCYGHPRLKTPNLDRLAQQGTLFTQFYVNGSVCSPSRCALMTGQYPARHRIHGHYADHALNAARGMSNWLDPTVPNVAALLKSAGYATAHIGKWHLGSGAGAPDPTAYGFDVARSMVCNNPAWTEPADTFWPKSTRLFVDEAIRFIEANKQRPFYVNLWTLLPHAPLNPTAEQMKPYDRFSWGRGVRHKSAETIYYASVADLDTQVGRLLAALDQIGVAENTLVVFSSDNGPEDIHIVNAGHSGVGSAGPFRGRKRSLYEGGVRVPFIVRWPGQVPAGRIDDTSVVAGVDFLPTVCKLAGIQTPAGHPLDGEDMSDVLRGAPRPRKTPLFWEWRFHIFGEPFHRSPILAIRQGDWKLLLNPDGSRVELYDIPRDPTQLNNLADRNQEVVKRLAEKVLAWQKTLPEGPIEPSAGRSDYPWPGKAGATPARKPLRKAKPAGRK